MSNSISQQLTVTSTVDGVRTVAGSNSNTQTSSSNFLAGGQEVTSSAWTDLSFSTLSDVITVTLTNDNTQYSQSVIQFASGSNGASILATIAPGFQAVIPWSGSLKTVSAKVVGYYVNSTFTITASATPAVQAGKGTIQFLAQQS
jgi:hypothetical protein